MPAHAPVCYHLIYNIDEGNGPLQSCVGIGHVIAERDGA